MFNFEKRRLWRAALGRPTQRDTHRKERERLRAAFFSFRRNAAAIAGYPAINVPMGNSFGLPVGITFTGTAFSEPKLIKLASGFEHVIKARIVPKFLPTLPKTTTHSRPRLSSSAEVQPHNTTPAGPHGSSSTKVQAASIGHLRML